MVPGKVPRCELARCASIAVLLVALAAVSGAQQQNDTMQGPERAFSFNGTNATFTCVSSLRNCVDMEWYQYDWDPESQTDWIRIHYNIHPSSTDKFIVDNSTLGCKLTITNVQRNDNGDYKCKFKNYLEGIAKLVVIVGQQENPLSGPANNFGYVDSNVNFVCYSPLKNCIGMYWFRVKVGGERNTICNASTGSCNSDKYNVERNNVGCQLTVKHLELSDAGSVICEILISQTTYEGTALLLVFNTTAHPLTPLDITGEYLGTNATITCSSPLRNCLEIQWYKTISPTERQTIFNGSVAIPDKYSVENSTTGCQLTVKSLELSDGGIFVCAIVGSSIPYERTVHLFLSRPLRGYIARYCTLRKEASFQCISPSQTCEKITWHRGRDSLSPPIAGHAYLNFSDKYEMTEKYFACVLILRNATWDDAGPYTCRHMDYSFQLTTELFVIRPDEDIMRMIPMYDVITVGKNVSMQCIPPSETCDNVTFHRGRESLSPPIAFRIYPDKIPPGRDKYVASRAWLGCLLIIRDAEVNDTGPYTCRFMNSFQVTAELYVVDTTTNPLTEIDNATGYVGSNATFNCGSPSSCLAIFWLKSIRPTARPIIFNGLIVEDNYKYSVQNSTTGCQLTIKHLEISDNGTYVCRILVSSKHYERTANLLVHE